jgi:isocitrate dehydrogenase
VIDAAVDNAYHGQRSLAWLEVFAGEKAQKWVNTSLPAETLAAFKEYSVGIKGPLTTPVGEGSRSLNVALRQELDLYVCLRPVKWLKGTPSPVCQPELWIWWSSARIPKTFIPALNLQPGTEENAKFLALLRENFPNEYKRVRFPDSSGIGIKPISKEGSTRLVRAAIELCLEESV